MTTLNIGEHVFVGKAAHPAIIRRFLPMNTGLVEVEWSNGGSWDNAVPLTDVIPMFASTCRPRRKPAYLLLEEADKEKHKAGMMRKPEPKKQIIRRQENGVGQLSEVSFNRDGEEQVAKRISPDSDASSESSDSWKRPVCKSEDEREVELNDGLNYGKSVVKLENDSPAMKLGSHTFQIGDNIWVHDGEYHAARVIYEVDDSWLHVEWAITGKRCFVQKSAASPMFDLTSDWGGRDGQPRCSVRVRNHCRSAHPWRAPKRSSKCSPAARRRKLGAGVKPS